MNNTPLSDLRNRFCTTERAANALPPRLSVYRRDTIGEFEAMIYEPVICLILQGGKVTTIGDQTADLHPGDALVVSHDLPVTSQITQASLRTPYIALILSLDIALIGSLHDLMRGTQTNPTARSLASGPADAEWLAPLLRYADLCDTPMDAKVLGPSILREIHYRLLVSPLGAMLRSYLVADTHAYRIARVTRTLRTEFRSPFTMPELAKIAGMGVTSFHTHFKAVTGTTPLQYQKDLRLIEARSLLQTGQRTVSEAAYAVGYESPTHFSREYRRKFGAPPSRDG